MEESPLTQAENDAFLNSLTEDIQRTDPFNNVFVKPPILGSMTTAETLKYCEASARTQAYWVCIYANPIPDEVMRIKREQSTSRKDEAWHTLSRSEVAEVAQKAIGLPCIGHHDVDFPQTILGTITRTHQNKVTGALNVLVQPYANSIEGQTLALYFGLKAIPGVSLHHQLKPFHVGPGPNDMQLSFQLCEISVCMVGKNPDTWVSGVVRLRDRSQVLHGPPPRYTCKKFEDEPDDNVLGSQNVWASNSIVTLAAGVKPPSSSNPTSLLPSGQSLSGELLSGAAPMSCAASSTFARPAGREEEKKDQFETSFLQAEIDRLRATTTTTTTTTADAVSGVDSDDSTAIVTQASSFFSTSLIEGCESTTSSIHHPSVDGGDGNSDREPVSVESDNVLSPSIEGTLSTSATTAADTPMDIIASETRQLSTDVLPIEGDNESKQNNDDCISRQPMMELCLQVINTVASATVDGHQHHRISSSSSSPESGGINLHASPSIEGQHQRQLFNLQSKQQVRTLQSVVVGDASEEDPSMHGRKVGVVLVMFPLLQCIIGSVEVTHLQDHPLPSSKQQHQQNTLTQSVLRAFQRLGLWLVGS